MFHTAMKKNKGFTLIELLVVISIISGLAALILPNFMAVREKGRDTERKADLRSFQQALELYRQNQSTPIYPTSIPQPDECWTTNGGEMTCSGNITYMKRVPGDPILKSGSSQLGYYFTTASSDTEYTLCSCLENTADPSGVAGNCNDSTYTCASGYKYEVTQP